MLRGNPVAERRVAARRKRAATAKDRKVAACLRGAGYSAQDMYEAGYSASLVKELGYTRKEMVKAGFASSKIDGTPGLRWAEVFRKGDKVVLIDCKKSPKLSNSTGVVVRPKVERHNGVRLTGHDAGDIMWVTPENLKRSEELSDDRLLPSEKRITTMAQGSKLQQALENKYGELWSTMHLMELSHNDLTDLKKSMTGLGEEYGSFDWDSGVRACIIQMTGSGLAWSPLHPLPTF